MKVFSFWASIEPYFLPVFHVFSWVYGVLLVNHWMTFLDDYKICTPTGKLEYFGENIWHEVKECHLNPNISEEAREFVERWDRWPLTFRVVISLFIYVVTLYATYNTVEYNWNCSPSKSIGHARVASILSEAFCFESIAILLISFFDVFVTNNTDGRPSAYSKVQCMNNIFFECVYILSILHANPDDNESQHKSCGIGQIYFGRKRRYCLYPTCS
ncbi:hypothetical protein M3Y95_00833100 [Aphelenchoides besseyi]|nr:hypothetical protein M3Y95_00833100 [Aphelenchoides besseyi]